MQRRQAVLSLVLTAAVAGSAVARDAGSDPFPRLRPELSVAPEPRPPEPRPPHPAPPDGSARTLPAAQGNRNTPPASGTLIPPEAYAEPVAPLAMAARPAAFEALRESDFDHAACLLALTVLGVDHVPVPALSEPGQRDCGIAHPVAVRAIQPGVTVEGDAVLRCDTARAMALWLREMVVPAVGRLPGSPRLTSVSVGTAYACRGIVGGPSEARVSEHALGNAIDIAGFGFDSGLRLGVGPVADRGHLPDAFQNAVQGSACLYFTTVLGPGSNAAHDDHLHLDIKARSGGLRLCQ